ncbi:Fasciclin domain family protein [Colletotrichum higginsianum IMI 349063]|uniref:Fasciclin domain family protein n=3 Tax=Colletotrichum higginsianum TaxID=80884 RepID=A0A1B7Y9B0_COLHI|nr:Fasciclin domain family protein [Colletotrichum higginsianum IMI 349063]OBR08438.1 Fasciclin domain family protein [Colletotrichum higginsianum IMI 349063]TIC95825.1 Periostin [Colletotrichum higginsianum]
MRPSRLLSIAAVAASAAEATVLPEDSVQEQGPMKMDVKGSGDLIWEGLPTRDSVSGAVLGAIGAGTRLGRWAVGYSDRDGAVEIKTTIDAPQQAGDAPRPDQNGETDEPTNMSVIDIIRQSDRATYFSKLLESYDKLRRMLEDGSREFTVFVPTDEAFRALEGFERSGGALLGEMLEYHVVEGRHTADGLRGAGTLATVLEEYDLGGRRQRLRIGVGLLGLEVNLYGRVVGQSKEGRDGMVHYLDGVLVPPPRCATLAEALPGRLGTFSRALGRTELGMEGESRRGGSVTLFAPSDEAWEETLSGEGRRFLFSREGTAWLRALVRYHVVEGAVYMGGGARGEDGRGSREVRNLLGDKVSVEVDGPEGAGVVRVDGVAVSVRDVPARDGVLHVLDGVLLPPAPGAETGVAGGRRGRVSVEGLKARLGRFVKEADGVESEEL